MQDYKDIQICSHSEIIYQQDINNQKFQIIKIYDRFIRVMPIQHNNTIIHYYHKDDFLKDKILFEQCKQDLSKSIVEMISIKINKTNIKTKVSQINKFNEIYTQLTKKPPKKENAFIGSYIHNVLAQYYMQQRNQLGSEQTARMIVDLQFNEDAKTRDIFCQQYKITQIKIQMNRKLIQENMSDVELFRIQQFFQVQKNCFDQKLEEIQRLKKQFDLRSEIFDDRFYSKILGSCIKQLDIKDINDQVIKIFILQRLEFMRITINDKQYDNDLKDYFKQEINRLNNGIMPHYVHSFIVQNKQINYTGQCDKVLTENDQIINF